MSHSFIDANFSRPTYCDHCQGLLWGLVKQGSRCSGTKHTQTHKSKATNQEKKAVE